MTGSAREASARIPGREYLISIGQDIRFVCRGLVRAPVFTAGVVATLAIGLGINSAVFRIADRVLMRAPAGVVAPRALRRVLVAISSGKRVPSQSSVMSYPQARAVADSRAFARASVYANVRGLRWPDGREVVGIYVDSGYFATLGVRAAIGRLFDRTEVAPGAEIPVVIVSHEYWQRELGAAALAALPLLKIGDRQYRVVGVAPAAFAGIDLDPVQVWLPFGIASLGQGYVNGTLIPWYRSSMMRAIRVVGRLADGESDERAASKAGTALSSLGDWAGGQSVKVELQTIHESRSDAGADMAAKLLARLILVSIVVLLIACANAANLLLARGLRRSRELAVRRALGAGRAQIIRLLVLESTILGIAGGGAAALAGVWIGESLRRLLFPSAHWTTAAVDDRSLLFTVSIALAAGVMAGLAPAVQLTSPDLVTGLKDNRYQPGRRSYNTRAVLIVVQTAFSRCSLHPDCSCGACRSSTPWIWDSIQPDW